MPEPYKIAVYTGSVPSTTFIERMIDVLSTSENRVMLFGEQTKPVAYPGAVELITYRGKAGKLLHYLKYAFLLFLFKRKEQQRLSQLVGNHTRLSFRQKLRYYPVLYHHPDIFHLQWAKGVGEWFWVRDFGIKLIVSLRGTHINISPKTTPGLHETYEKYFPLTDGFHAVSKAMVEEVKAYGVPENRVAVVYNAVPKLKMKSAAEIDTLPVRVLSVGRSHWVKGYTYALDACRLLRSEEFPFHYTIVGASGDEELIYQRTQLRLEQQVDLLPGLPFEKVAALMTQAHILLLPSLEEGLANVVTEAMSAGTLVISTDCGGMREMVRDGETGLLIPARSPEAIAKAIRHLSALSAEERQHMRTRAKQTVDRIDTASMAAGLKQLYEQTLNG